MSFKYFSMLSRMSEFFSKTGAPKHILPVDEDRISLLLSIISDVESGKIKDLRKDGQRKLNDYSHAGEELLGYFAHSTDPFVGGRRMTRKVHRQMKK